MDDIYQQISVNNLLYGLQCTNLHFILYHRIYVGRRKKARSNCKAGAIKVRRVSCNPHRIFEWERL